MEILTALALVFFIEGCFYALMPGRMKIMMRLALELDEATLRRVGIAALCFGFALAWGIRSLAS